MKSPLQTDCLIVGSGIAGLSAALAAADRGLGTLVLTCAATPEETNSAHAQGGIIFKSAEGDPEKLVEDILEAGCHVNSMSAVRQLVDLGPSLVREILIDRAGISFAQGPRGELQLTREGGHSIPRILHWGDESGKAIEDGLLKLCQKHPKIRFRVRSTAVNLLMTGHHNRDRARRYEDSRCFGAFVFDQEKGEVYPIFAAHTVLATGGIGQIFLHNTNSKFARGDGIALAHRAGCRLQDLEYIQFHPTTFFHPGSRRFLISEAVRGEGGVLLNQAGERFLPKYLPTLKHPELAPRDRVARAIHQEMLTSGASCVYLDISHKSPEWVQQRFPFVYRSCLKFGVDITKQPIPVVPGAHYLCGGIWTNLEGKTSIENLWAVGETACTGVHGANRLASTSLLEGLVWGSRAGESIAARIAENPVENFPEIEEWQSETSHVDASFFSQDWLTLKNTMWNYVGLIKTEARLKRAEGILTELYRGIENFYRKATLSDSLIGLRHASLVSLLVLEACKKNPRSLGCYQREDLEI